jgi:hypothetical protein
MKLGVVIKREPPAETFPFVDLFLGFEKVGAVKKMFGRDCGPVLEKTMVHMVTTKGYLRVDNDTGDIIICEPYLKSADERFFYLDLVHELVHVKQHHEGRELYDRTYAYVDRPTEIEAYTVAVSEARRIGLSDDEIVDYLKVEWVSDADFRRMLKTLGVAQTRKRKGRVNERNA